MQSALQQTFAYYGWQQHCKEGTSCLWEDYDVEEMFVLLPLIWSVAAFSMSQIVLGTVYCIECFVEQTVFLLHNGASDNVSMFCDMIWNLEVALYYFLSRCIKYL